MTKKLKVALEEKYGVEQKMVILLDEVGPLGMENDSRQCDFSKLEQEVKKLKKGNRDLKKIVHNFTNGRENFEKLIGSQKTCF